MSTEKPSFTTKSLPVKKITKTNPKPRRVSVKKTLEKRKKEQVIKPIKIKRLDTEKKEKSIGKKLASIYKDNEGHIPNMKRIKIKKTHPVLKFFFSLIIVGGLLAAAAWTGFFILPNNTKFSDKNVDLEIKGPTEISLGATTTYSINYNNRQNYSLTNTILTVQYPKGFIFVTSSFPAKNSGNTEWDLNTIKPKQKNSITITGKTYGAIKQAETWRVFLTYKPENYNYKSQKASTLNVGLKDINYTISIIGPDKVVLNDDAQYIFSVEKKDGAQLEQLELQASWSGYFNISTSSPALNDDNKWIIETNDEKKWEFKVKGKFTQPDKEGGSKIDAVLAIPVEAKEGQYYELAQTTLNTKLLKNELNLDLAINGSTSNFNTQPGKTLNFTVYFKNTSKNELKDAIIKLSIDAPSANNRSMLDWPEIIDGYDGDILGTQLNATIRRGDITWYNKYIPELSILKPGKDVTINLSIPIRTMKKFDLTQLKTQEIKVSAQANFKNDKGDKQSLQSNDITITTNSDLELEIRDSISINSKSQETHDLKWILTNNLHSLKDILVTADVYGKAEWKTKTKAPAGDLSYDNKTQKITWKIPTMPESLDILALPFTITVLEKNPTQQLLISKVKLEAYDEVTKKKIEIIGKEIGLK